MSIATGRNFGVQSPSIGDPSWVADNYHGMDQDRKSRYYGDYVAGLTDASQELFTTSEKPAPPGPSAPPATSLRNATSATSLMSAQSRRSKGATQMRLREANTRKKIEHTNANIAQDGEPVSARMAWDDNVYHTQRPNRTSTPGTIEDNASMFNLHGTASLPPDYLQDDENDGLEKDRPTSAKSTPARPNSPAVTRRRATSAGCRLRRGPMSSALLKQLYAPLAERRAALGLSDTHITEPHLPKSYAWMNAGPDYRYLDRHACCHKSLDPQIYESLIASRPLTPAESTSMPCSDREMRAKAFRISRSRRIERPGSKTGIQPYLTQDTTPGSASSSQIGSATRNRSTGRPWSGLSNTRPGNGISNRPGSGTGSRPGSGSRYRPGSVASRVSQNGSVQIVNSPPAGGTGSPQTAHVGYPAKQRQYMNSMRPVTAPTTRREFHELPRQNNVSRGDVPHFCNFIRTSQIHAREKPAPTPAQRLARAGPVRPDNEICPPPSVKLEVRSEPSGTSSEVEDQESCRPNSPDIKDRGRNSQIFHTAGTESNSSTEDHDGESYNVSGYQLPLNCTRNHGIVNIPAPPLVRFSERLAPPSDQSESYSDDNGEGGNINKSNAQNGDDPKTGSELKVKVKGHAVRQVKHQTVKKKPKAVEITPPPKTISPEPVIAVVEPKVEPKPEVIPPVSPPKPSPLSSDHGESESTMKVRSPVQKKEKKQEERKRSEAKPEPEQEVKTKPENKDEPETVIGVTVEEERQAAAKSPVQTPALPFIPPEDKNPYQSTSSLRSLKSAKTREQTFIDPDLKKSPEPEIDRPETVTSVRRYSFSEAVSDEVNKNDVDMSEKLENEFQLITRKVRKIKIKRGRFTSKYRRSCTKSCKSCCKTKPKIQRTTEGASFMELLEKQNTQMSDVQALAPQRYQAEPTIQEPEIQPDTSISERSKGPIWLQGRLALSKQACRFELPMDMRLLETLSAQDYIRRYCVLSTRRQMLYKRIFMKYKEKGAVLSHKNLEKAMGEVLVHSISSAELKKVFDLIHMTSETAVDFALFAGLASLAERMLYPKFLTEETRYLPEHQKDQIECADFCSLDWKFNGITVNPQIQHILSVL